MEANILNILREYRDIYELIGDVYRAAAYSTALRAYAAGEPVTAGIAKKIVAIERGEPLADLIELQRSPFVRAARSLGSILGVGKETVAVWFKRGITNRTQLRVAVRDGTVKLNHMQALGLRHYTHLHMRVPRDVITEFSRKFREMVRKIYPNASVIPAGSYRRGAIDSSDIDLLVYDVTRPDISTLVIGADAIVMSGQEKTTALYRIDGIVRSVDIIVVSTTHAAAALLYLTGSAEFNERMRGVAKRAGMRLNQHGLWRNNVLIPTKTEREIFEKLSIKYTAPRYR